MSITKEALNIRATSHDLENGERDLAQNSNPHDVLFVVRTGDLLLQGAAITAAPGKPLDRLIEPCIDEEDATKISHSISPDKHTLASREGGLTIISNRKPDIPAPTYRHRTGEKSLRHPLINVDPVYSGPNRTPILTSIIDSNDRSNIQISLSRITSAGKVSHFRASVKEIRDGVGYFLPAYGSSGKPYQDSPKPIRVAPDDTKAKDEIKSLFVGRAQILIYPTSIDPGVPHPGPWLNEPSLGKAIRAPQRSSSHY